MPAPGIITKYNASYAFKKEPRAMIYYHSAFLTGLPETEENRAAFRDHKISVLVSYYDFRPAYWRKLEFFDKQVCNFMLDSGAFSAFTQKKPIDLKKYIAFIKEHMAKLTCYIALDVIGDAKASVENYKTMRQNGLDPIPVWHPPFSSTDVLKEYLDLGAKYICFGAIASALKAKAGNSMYYQLCPKIDKAFELLQKYPGTKVHGLGISSDTLTKMYPWYSLDSSAMMIYAGYGHVMFKNKVYHVTGSSWENKDYYMNPPTRRKDEFLANVARLGFDIEKCKVDHGYRMLLCVLFYDEFIAALPPAVIKPGIQENLF